MEEEQRVKEQSESLHARLTWRDLLRLDACSRSHPHPPQPATGQLTSISSVVPEHGENHWAGTNTSPVYAWPATLRHR